MPYLIDIWNQKCYALTRIKQLTPYIAVNNENLFKALFCILQGNAFFVIIEEIL